MSIFKQFVKKIIPRSVLDRRSERIATQAQNQYGMRSAREAFADIYRRNVWGGEEGEFYSGGGSEGEFAEAYAEVIRKFISENNVGSVVDLGCGDMRVASSFITPEINYIGCDIVPDLIEHHQRTNKFPNAEFRCINIIEDDLPQGDLCLIRQVLQHLSNAEISRILQKVGKYRYLIISEHYPADGKMKSPNLDIPHGPHTRLVIDSAVVLDAEPFNLDKPIKLFERTDRDGSRIMTFLITAKQK